MLTPLHTTTSSPQRNGLSVAMLCLTMLVFWGDHALAQVSFVDPPADDSALCQYVPGMPTVRTTSSCPGSINLISTEWQEDVACANTYTLVRRWVATDACGDSVVHVQRTEIADTQPPILTGVPANQTVAPGNVPPVPTAGAFDFCDPTPTLTVVKDSVEGPCGGYTLTFLYTAADACGNERSRTYVLSVSGATPPTFGSVPSGRRLSCGESLPAAPAVEARDKSGSVVASTVRIDTLGNRGGDTCLIIQRTWTATDACGLPATARQTYTLHDGQAPQLLNVPADTVVYCEVLPPVALVTATDNCDPDTRIEFEEISEQTNSGECSDVTYLVRRRWTAIDACGSVVTAEQVISMKCECCDNGIDDDDDGLIDDYDPQCNCFAGVADDCDQTKRYFIPPVWHPNSSQYNQPSELVLTTLSDVANVHIMTADGTTYNETFTVVKGTPTVVPLTSDQLQTPNHNQIERDKGWILTSDQLIQPIYRIDGFYNKVLVTIKGPQGMGRVFRAGSQTNTCGTNDMNTGEGHFISVMATEDNTEVTLDYSFPALNGLAGPVTRTLNRFETYLIRDDRENTTVSGSLITSTKPIVVMSGSQHTKACRYPDDGSVTAGQDGGIDQLVPNCLTGDEYVLVRGKRHPVQQYAILVANKNNTRVVVNGDVNETIVLSAGEHHQYYLDGGAYDPRHFKANKPFYMFHVSGISGNNEVGMAIAAPVGECKGDTLIQFPRFGGAGTSKMVDNSVYAILPASGLASLRINGSSYTGCATERAVPARANLRVVVFENSCLADVNTISSDAFFTAGLLVGIDGETGTHGYLTAFKDRMSVFEPGSSQPTVGYLIDTLCGEQTVSHCIDVASCATEHSIAAIRGGVGTVTLTGGTCLDYTSPADFQGEDELFVTLQNNQGLFQTICLRYYICGEPPVAVFPFMDTVVTCEAVPLLENPQASDECGMNVFFDTEEVRDDGTCDYSYIIYRHWTIWDDCGDSTRATQTIRVADTTAPQAINIVSDTLLINCGPVPAPPVPTFVENCDSDYDYSYVQVTLDSLCPYEKTLLRTWEAWDRCGNRSTAFHRIEVRDTVGPTLQVSPAIVEIGCGEVAAQPQVLMTSGCDVNAVLTQDSVLRPAECDTVQLLVRTWTVADACGRTATASQLVIVRDTLAPTVSNVPADVTLRCGEPLPTDVPTFADECTSPLTVVEVDSLVDGLCPELEVVYRTWSVVDDCGRMTTAQQRIAVADMAPPVITALADTVFGSCVDTVTFLEPNITDDCGFTLTRRDSVYSADCATERFVFREFVATDACGNSAQYTQLYYFRDTVAPVWVTAPADLQLTCADDVPPPVDVTVVDACSGINPIAIITTDSSISCPATRWIFREYTVSDWCGNLGTYVHTIRIDGCEPAIPALATAQASCTGSDIVLAVNVDSGYTTPVYRWEYSAGGNSGWSQLAQPSDSSTLTIPNATVAREGRYRVVVADNVVALGDTSCSSVSPILDIWLSDPTTSFEHIDLCRGDTLFYLGDTLSQNLTRTDTLYTVDGCDSVATLELAVYPFVDYTLDTVLCFGESLSIYGQNYSASGNYRDTLITPYGCDTTLQLNLTVLPPYRDTIYAALCVGTSYTYGGDVHTVAGTYEYPLTSVLAGCDSTEILVLSTADAVATTIDTTICFGESVEAGGTSHSTSGRYDYSLLTKQGCDSLVTLNLQVIDTAARVVNVALCQGDSYYIGNKQFSAAGTYRETITGALGCDSNVVVTITMSDRYEQEISARLCDGEVYTNGGYSFAAAGRWPMKFTTADGCDSTVYVSLRFDRNYQNDVVKQLCAGETYMLFDTLLTTAGTYQRSGQSVRGCDSTVLLTLSYAQPTASRIDTSLCFGESLLVAGQRFSTTTRDTVVMDNAAGCDSSIVLNLFVASSMGFDTTAVICADEVFAVAGRSYTETGVYQDSSTSVSGCDSVYTLYLTAIPEKRDTMYADLCRGDSIMLADGSTYTTGGEYTIRYPTASNCDSTLVLILDVYEPAVTNLTLTGCEGQPFAYNGSTLDTAGNYTFTLQTSRGCDSTVLLELRHEPISTTSSDTLLCTGETLMWGGNAYTTSGEYADVRQSARGCDSILLINAVFYAPVAQRDTVHRCEGDGVQLGDVWVTEAGLHETIHPGRYGCDSLQSTLLVLHGATTVYDTVSLCDGQTYRFGDKQLSVADTYVGDYSTSYGCDSTVVLTLLVANTLVVKTEGGVICEGGFLQLEAFTNGRNITWAPAEGLSCSDCVAPTASPSGTTTYTVTATACDGSTSSAEATVVVNPGVTVGIVAVERLRRGESTTLRAVTGGPTARLEWRENNQFLCDNCREVDVQPTETTVYDLDASSDAGCDATAQLTLVVEDDCAFGDVSVPNIVTPNNDGHNDELEIRYEGIQEIVLLRIFNRWGELIYETRNIDNFWDGSHHGMPVNPGVFMYYIEGFCLNNEPFTQEGNVTVVR